MITKPKVYLSGGMEKTDPTDPLGGKWREWISQELTRMNFTPLNITEMDKDYTAQFGDDFRTFGSPEDHVVEMRSNIRRHFIDADVRLIIQDTDIVVLLYDESVRKGAGTLGEAQIAYCNSIPLFVINAFNDFSELPGWLVGLSTKIFNSFDDLLTYFEVNRLNQLHRDIYGNVAVGDDYLCFLCGDTFTKHKQHYVSRITPTYCKSCVDMVVDTNENHKDRYQFFLEYIEQTKEH